MERPMVERSWVLDHTPPVLRREDIDQLKAPFLTRTSLTATVPRGHSSNMWYSHLPESRPTCPWAW
jgi:hypothetical protein